MLSGCSKHCKLSQIFLVMDRIFNIMNWTQFQFKASGFNQPSFSNQTFHLYFVYLQDDFVQINGYLSTAMATTVRKPAQAISVVLNPVILQ